MGCTISAESIRFNRAIPQFYGPTGAQRIAILLSADNHAVLRSHGCSTAGLQYIQPPRSEPIHQALWFSTHSWTMLARITLISVI